MNLQGMVRAFFNLASRLLRGITVRMFISTSEQDIQHPTRSIWGGEGRGVVVDETIPFPCDAEGVLHMNHSLQLHAKISLRVCFSLPSSLACA